MLGASFDRQDRRVAIEGLGKSVGEQCYVDQNDEGTFWEAGMRWSR